MTMFHLELKDSVWTRSGKIRTPWRFRLAGHTKSLGDWGEWVALKHLRKLGWDIVARNWRGRCGEADLIVYDGPFLVFVEVKTRLLPTAIEPEEGVDLQKERKLDEVAFEFLLRHEIPETPIRLDVVGITTEDLRQFTLRHYIG